MEPEQAKEIVERAWEKRDALTPRSGGEERQAVESALDALDSGALRVCEKQDGEWIVKQWLKKVVLLSFRLNDMMAIAGGPGAPARCARVRRRVPRRPGAARGRRTRLLAAVGATSAGGVG